VTGLVDIYSNVVQGGSREGTYHPPHCVGKMTYARSYTY